jgi:hypothetical protein
MIWHFSYHMSYQSETPILAQGVSSGQHNLPWAIMTNLRHITGPLWKHPFINSIFINFDFKIDQWNTWFYESMFHSNMMRQFTWWRLFQKLNLIFIFWLLSLGWYLCWWTIISPIGYQLPSSQCFGTDMVY